MKSSPCGVPSLFALFVFIAMAAPGSPPIIWPDVDPLRVVPDLDAISDERLIQLWNETVAVCLESGEEQKWPLYLYKDDEYDSLKKTPEAQAYLIDALDKALGARNIDWNYVYTVLTLMAGGMDPDPRIPTLARRLFQQPRHTGLFRRPVEMSDEWGNSYRQMLNALGNQRSEGAARILYEAAEGALWGDAPMQCRALRQLSSLELSEQPEEISFLRLIAVVAMRRLPPEMSQPYLQQLVKAHPVQDMEEMTSRAFYSLVVLGELNETRKALDLAPEHGPSRINPMFVMRPPMHDFAIRPTVPFEDTTFEQDDLIILAERAHSSKRLQACAALIADETLPMPLRGWAVRQRLRHGDAWEDIEAGMNWLRDHEDSDIDPFTLRYYMAFKLTYGMGHRDIPSLDWGKAVFEEIFRHHPPEDERVIQSRLYYATFLQKFAWSHPEAKEQMLREMEEAMHGLVLLLQNEALEEDERQRLEHWLVALEEAHARDLAHFYPQPLSPEESLERSRQIREERRLIRLYLLNQKKIHFGNLSDLHEFYYTLPTDPDFIQFKEERLNEERARQ